MAKKSQWTAIITLLIIAGIIISGALAWNYNWLNLRFRFENQNADETNPSIECPKTSYDTSTPCCKRLESGELKPSVSVIYIRSSCGCPSDTKSLGYAPEGENYLLCNCTACQD